MRLARAFFLISFLWTCGANSQESAPYYDWSGFYLGATAGAAYGQYHLQTTATPGPAIDAASASVLASQSAAPIKPQGFAGGGEAGYNWQAGRFVIGTEADLQSLQLNATGNTGAVQSRTVPTVHFVARSNANTNWLLTARARAGIVAANNWLLFATGGLAVTRFDNDIFFYDTRGYLEEGKLDSFNAGYAVGGGVEAPLTEHVSVKAEYQYVHFGDTNAKVINNTYPVFGVSQAMANNGDFSASIVRAGLNYRFDNGASSPGASALASLWPGPSVPALSNWESEVGTRVWFSSGQIGAPQPLFNQSGTQVISRLTFTDRNAWSGEAFARFDHASGFFVKGFLGGGGIDSGHLFDEDFPATGHAYSKTQSDASGHIGYATIDLGYVFLKTPLAKVGAFVGYNYYADDVLAYGCAQQAGASICNPAPSLTNYPVIRQFDRYDSLRLGVSTQFMLTNRLRLSGDAAFVPIVKFKGEDDHNTIARLEPESSAAGDGVMLEAIIGYDVTDAWNVGIGGRYWAWNMHTGHISFDDVVGGFVGVEHARYNAERYGVFLQTSYKWGGDVNSAQASAAMAATPMNWTGFYIGGHMGAAASVGRWSDPFGATPGTGGFTNQPGFGDETRATGGFGGGQIGFDVQRDAWVVGLQADATRASLRGENTCFSGIGGIDCQQEVGAIGVFAGRAGYTWDRALAYVKGGPAVVKSTYSLNGNTEVLTLGTGSTKSIVWGWAAGGGIEYALTDQWAAVVEYDHLETPASPVAFPSVARISGQDISVRQTLDLVELGLNYRFKPESILVSSHD